MYIRNLTIDEFNTFADECEYSTYHQSFNYALLKSENDYEYEFIGLVDSNKIYAACLVLAKMLNGYVYAYIPEGFLIDYHNTDLINKFIDALYKYYKKENIVFIKINPSLPIAKVDPATHGRTPFGYENVPYTFINSGLVRVNDDNNFKNVLPLIKPVINLDKYTYDSLSKNTRNKVRKATRKGLVFEKADETKLNYLYYFTKRKINKTEYYYKDYYNIFNKTGQIDYFLVSIDYIKYLNTSKLLYEKELDNNKILNENLRKKASKKNVNNKIASDKVLEIYKSEVFDAANHINDTSQTYVAGALVIRYKDTATIIISGYDKKYRDFDSNYFLYYNIINYYKDKVKYLNLNGISNDLTNTNKYHGLNEFKLGFNPELFETVGEYDMVFNKKIYAKLEKKGLLEKEFDNKAN